MHNRSAAVSVAGFLALAVAAGVAAAVEIGEPAPSFSLATARGEPIVLPDLRGRVVYVDFWASWCGPCKRSFPWMNEMQERYGDRGLTIVAVNVDRRRGDAEQFLRTNAARFTVVYDERGETPLAYAVKGMPSSYLVDARGTVVDVEQGFRDERKSALEDHIRSFLSGR